jgi:ligand-binding sensor domain-containing protein
MIKLNNKSYLVVTSLVTSVILLLAVFGFRSTNNNEYVHKKVHVTEMSIDERITPSDIDETFPVYRNWRSYTTKNGLPSDKAFCIRVDGDRIWVGTDAGLAVLEDDKWRTYTVDDGLAHRGVLSVDINEMTGDIWIATFSGLNRLSGGKFETFNQFNSGLPNDVIYQVVCDGKDVWVATGGGAGRYDTYTKQWSIFTEQNAPMHEPWTYGITKSKEKIYIAAWGGGVIEYDKRTGKFRDYVDPDGEMELDLFPDDGLVHNITTGVSYSDDVLWVGTYFGLSRYDGTHWKGYFDHDSGLPSNFINFIKAKGSVVWICTDNGLSSFNGERWITYNPGGEIVITEENGVEKNGIGSSIAHNFVMGVDFQGDDIWVATSKGVSFGTLSGI